MLTDVFPFLDVFVFVGASLFPLAILQIKGVQNPLAVPYLVPGVLCLVDSGRFSPRRGSLGFVWAMAGAGALHLWLRPESPAVLGHWPTLGAASGLYAFIALFSRRMARHKRALVVQAAHKEIWRDRLGRILPPRAVERIEREGGVKLGGEEGDAAVLFTDVREFTALSERLGPSETMRFLNRYFTAMVDIVFAHGGTVDKFLGDGILVVFQRPFTTGECAERAVACAQTMIETAEKLGVSIGAGVHYGPVLSGWIGSELRPEYTVLGDTVNVASRIEALTKTLRRSLLFSGAVKDRLPDSFSHELLGPSPLRGRAEPIDLFSLRPAEKACQTPRYG